MDNYKEHTFHVPAEDNVLSFSNKQFEQSVHDNDQQVEGAVFTVGSGFKQNVSENVAENLLLLAILFNSVLLLFNAPKKLTRPGFQFPHYWRIAYSLQNPRAPPR